MGHSMQDEAGGHVAVGFRWCAAVHQQMDVVSGGDLDPQSEIANAVGEGL